MLEWNNCWTIEDYSLLLVASRCLVHIRANWWMASSSSCGFLISYLRFLHDCL